MSKNILDILRQAHREITQGATCDKPAATVPATGIASLLSKNTAQTISKPKTADPGWQPRVRDKRVMIVIDASVGRLDVCRQATAMIEKLYDDGRLTKGQLETKLVWSMDDCIHSTKWETSPRDVGDQTRGAHCYQGQTRFADALDIAKRDTQTDGKPVDAIIVIGDRCDEKPETLTALSRDLAREGTKIFAFDLGSGNNAEAGYQAMTDATGGLNLRLTSEKSLDQIIPPLVDHLFHGDKALIPLERSKNSDARLLASRLRITHDKSPKG